MRPPFAMIAFLLLPILEIATFVIVGQWIGVLKTIALVMFSGILGVAVLRRQGFNAHSALNRGPLHIKDSAKGLASGVLLVLAGILLLVPGFLTDIVALLLFIPSVRNLIWRKSAKSIKVQTFTNSGFHSRPSHEAVDLDPTDFRRTEPANQPSSGQLRHED